MKTEYGCPVKSGFMGETCLVCKENNFGGELCKSVEERKERERENSD